MFQIVLVKNHQTKIPVESEEGESLVSRSLAALIHEGNETLDSCPQRPPGRYHYHVASCEGLYRGGESLSGPGGDWLDSWWFVSPYPKFWMFPKIGVTPKMDGENNGKTLLKWMIRGENPLFSETSKWIDREISELPDILRTW